MSAPLYFLAGATRDSLVAPTGQLKSATLAKWRLDDVLADCASKDHVSVSEINTRGPGNQSGTLLYAIPTHGRLADRMGFYPDLQEWQQVEESGLWIGLSTHEPVAPEDLCRRGTRVNPDGSPAAPFAGHLCTLADGNLWEVPVVRRPDAAGSTNLPQRFVRTGGVVRGDLLPTYRAIWEATSRACTAFFPRAAEDSVVETDWSIDLAVRGLALNYRFGWDLQNRLGLLDTTNWEVALGALVDFPLYMAMARAVEADRKKKAADVALEETPQGCTAGSTSTPPGPTAD